MDTFSQHKSYTAKKLSQPIKMDSEWNKAPWSEIDPLHLSEYMGDEPIHRPRVQVKAAYDQQAVYLIFKVEDRYVKSIREQYQDPVYKDSAVEFFFCPADDTSKGYFNLEVNCGGTALFRHQSMQGKIPIPHSVFKDVEIAHSLPRTVDPEIQDPVTWTLEMRLPVQILEEYYDITRPESGARWRANFYKIADESSYPHYLTWSKVNHPKPNFHLPQYFGMLNFE